ncbi:MAG: hypothetical protein HS116_25925 [Planctomycetes bacterium]|nr:hypothetical protein [Planctomycetota bacterium]
MIRNRDERDANRYIFNTGWLIPWVLCLGLSFSIQAADRYWVASAPAGGNWNVAANWSATSGGSGGATVPGASDIAIFDGGGLGNCTFNLNVSVLGFRILTGYTGVIAQGAFTFTVGLSNYSQDAATFGSGSANITMTGSFTLNGGSFTTTSGATAINAPATLSGGTLTANGPITFGTASSLALDGGTFAAGASAITFTSPASATQSAGFFNASTGTLTVGGSWTMAGGVFNGAAGAVVFTGGFTLNAGTFKVPSTTVTSNGGWTVSGGAFDLSNNGTVVFGNTQTIQGSHTLGNVRFNDGSSTARTYTVSFGTVLTVSGTLGLSSGLAGNAADLINTGTLEALGDISVLDAGGGIGGTATLRIAGTGAQTLTGSGSTTSGNLPPIEIAKPSGTLFLSGIVRTASHWTYTSGTLDTSGHTMVFAGTLTISGTHTLGDVSFNDNAAANAVYTIAFGTTLNVSGTLSLSSGTAGVATDTIVTGTLNALGNVVATPAGSGIGGTALLRIAGSANQTLTGSGSTTNGNLPPVEIAKPSGTLFLSGTIRTGNNWTYTGGTLDPAGSSLVFAAALTISGSHALQDVMFFDNAAANVAYTVAFGTTLTVRGNLLLSSGLPGVFGDSVNSGVIEVQGHVSAVDFGGGMGGSATIRLIGTGAQTLTGSGSPTNGNLPGIQIAKPSGTLTLSGIIRTASSWTYASGALNVTGSTLVFAGTLTVSGSHTLNDVTFNDNSSSATSSVYTIALGTTLTVNGALNLSSGIAGNSSDSINTGTLVALGHVTTLDFGGGVGGSATIRIAGSGAQTLTGSGSATGGNLPAIQIAKPSGTLTLAGTVRTTNSWTYTSGALDVTGSTLVFAGTLTITGSHALNDVTFNDNSASTTNSVYTVAAGTTLTVNGALSLSSGVAGNANDSINTGTVAALGSVSSPDAGGGIGGSATIRIAGSGAQTLTADGNETSGNLPGVQIAKPSGTLALSGIIRTAGNWTYTSGGLNVAGSTLVFAGSLTLSGSHTLETVIFRGANSSFTFATGTTLTVSGALTLADGRLLQSPAPANGTVRALDAVSVQSTWDNADTGRLVFAGAGNQIFDLTGASDLLNSPVVLEKPSGAVLLTSSFVANATGQTVTVTSGTLDVNGFDLTVTGALTVASGAALRLQGGEALSTPVLLAGSTVRYAGNTSGFADTYTLKAFAYRNLVLEAADAGETFELPSALVVLNDLTLAGGVLDASAGNFGLTVGGAWNASAGGAFESRMGAVFFNDATQVSTLTGSTPFFDLTVQTPNKALVFEAGSTQTVAGALTFNGGASATRVQLDSSAPGTPWFIDPQGTRSIQFVDVSDSTNIHATAILAANSIDSGNNVNWDFALDPQAAAAPLIVLEGSATNLSSAPIGGSGVYTTFAWSGPGGFSSAAQNPGAVTPPNLGANVYQLTVTDSSSGTGMASVTVTVLATLAANPMASPDSLEDGESTSLFSTPTGGSGPYTFLWSGPGGFTSTLQNPGIVTPPGPGSHVYTLTVTDSNSFMATDTVTINVGVPAPSGTLVLSSARVFLNFNPRFAGRDYIKIKGMVDLPAGLNPLAANTGSFEFGGIATGDLALAANGASPKNPTKGLRFAFKKSGSLVRPGPAVVTAYFKFGSFADEMAAFGMTNETVSTTVSVPAEIALNGFAYRGNAALVYKGVAGSKGTAK